MSATAIIVLSIILVLIMLFIFLTPRVRERPRLETKKEEINNYNTNVNKTLVIINNNHTYSTQNFLMPADDDIHYEDTVHIPDIIIHPDPPAPSTLSREKDIPDLPTTDNTPDLSDVEKEQTFTSTTPGSNPPTPPKKGKISIALPVPKPDPKEPCQIFVTNDDVYIATPKTIFNLKIKDIVKASTKKQQSYIGTKKLGFMLDFKDEKKTLQFLEILKKKKKKLEELARQRRNRAKSMASSPSSTQAPVSSTPIPPMTPNMNEQAMVMKKKKF